MSELPQSALCPFDALLDKRILGDATPEDRERLEAHLRSGCASCAERWKQEERLEGLIHGVLEPIAQEVEIRREPVLDKLKERLEKEEQLRRDLRRRRRVGMNAILFLIVALGVTLLSVEFLAFNAMRKKLVRAQRVVADAEVAAIRLALMKLALERGPEQVPLDRGALYKTLTQRRLDSERMYYQPDPGRIDPTTLLLLDPWGRPYAYKRVADQFKIYSVGLNGADEDGVGDDVGGVSAILPAKKEK